MYSYFKSKKIATNFVPMHNSFRYIVNLHFVGFLLLIFCFQYRVKAQEILTISNQDTGSINTLLDEAKKMVVNGNFDSAKQYYENTHAQSTTLKYVYGVVKSKIGLGNIAVHRGDYNQALLLYKNALTQCTTPAANSLQTTIYNNIGNIYTLKGDFINSAVYYEKALTAAEMFKAELPKETLYNNISIAHNRLHNPQKALGYLHKAESLALHNNNFYTLADVYNNKGLSYSEMMDFENSTKYYNNAISVSKQYGYINTLYSAYTNLGIILLNQNRIDDGVEQLKQAQAISKDISSYQKNMLLLALSSAMLKKNEPIKAKVILMESLRLAEHLDNLKDQITSHTLLAEVYRRQKRFDSAFYHKELELILSDSFKRKEIAHAVAEVEQKYNTALKDKNLAEQQLTITHQKAKLSTITKWMVGIFSFATVLLLFIWFQRKHFLHKQALKNQELFNMQNEQRILAMKALIEGEENERIRLSREIHDNIMVQFSVIKMGLSTLTGNGKQLLTPEEIKPVITQLDEATENLRRTAHNLMPDMLLEDGLIETLYFFCDNIQKALPISIGFQPIGILPKFEAQFELTVYRIIQELVQNIIKHAKATDAIVQISFDHNLLSITVEDNGCGMNVAKGSQGFGLKSIAARIANYSGTMDIDSNKNVGTTIHLLFEAGGMLKQ